MQVLSKKLNGRGGASILLALVFFLLCGFIGAVVLGSATTNAQKIQDKRAQQQAYFAVSSAARLLQAQWGGSRCQGWESKTEHTCAVHDRRAAAVYRLIPKEGAEGFITAENDSLLTQSAWRIFLNNAQYGTHKAAVSTPYETGFTVTLPEEDFPEVAGTLAMENDYSATVVLRIQGSPEDDPANTITLCFAVAAGGEAASASKRPDGQCSYWVSDDSEEGGHTEYRDKETTTLTTSVVWDRGTILKGAPKHEA